MMDLAADVRAAQAVLERARAELSAARTAFDSAAAAYDRTRRTTQAGGVAIGQARAAWALAGYEWLAALIDHAAATDSVAERRTTDRAAADAPHLPSARTR